MNHDCISVESKTRKKGLAYNGPSIDEVCLLDMSQSAENLEFTDRDSTHMRLRNNNSGKEESYELIKVFEFESDRKCMTVIVKDEAGKYWAYCKGADSSILPKITHCLKEGPLVKSIPDFVEGMKFDHLDKQRSDATIAELKTCD